MTILLSNPVMETSTPQRGQKAWMEAAKRQQDISEIPSLSMIIPMTPTVLRILRQFLSHPKRHIRPHDAPG